MVLRIRLTTIITCIVAISISLLKILELCFFIRSNSTYDLNEYISTQTFILIGLLLIVLICSFVLCGYLIKPLLSLAKSLDGHSAIDLGSVEISELTRDDEIGQIARKFSEINVIVNQKTAEITEKNFELKNMENQINSLFFDTISALVKAVDARDPYTSFHSSNVAKYSFKLALKIGLEDEARNIMIGAQLHDIGKISIPEHILNKPGRLSEQEEKIMREHPLNGYEIVSKIDELKRRGIPEIVLYHHERIDGLGYPMGLAGLNIPLAARIVGIADAFDAMTTNRGYRAALDKSTAINQLLKHAGTQFDEDLVMNFLLCLSEDPDLFENKTNAAVVYCFENNERALRTFA